MKRKPKLIRLWSEVGREVGSGEWLVVSGEWEARQLDCVWDCLVAPHPRACGETLPPQVDKGRKASPTPSFSTSYMPHAFSHFPLTTKPYFPSGTKSKSHSKERPHGRLASEMT